MAIATLTHNLDDADDRMAHLRAVKSTSMAIALFDIQHNLGKQMIQHIESNPGLNAESAANEVLVRIRQILEEQGIVIDELIN